MDNSNTIKCKRCNHDKSEHFKFVRNPDFNNGSEKELNAGVCNISGCDCKFFEKKEENTTEYKKND